jgi:hypothetical protein
MTKKSRMNLLLGFGNSGVVENVRQDQSDRSGQEGKQGSSLFGWVRPFSFGLSTVARGEEIGDCGNLLLALRTLRRPAEGRGP